MTTISARGVEGGVEGGGKYVSVHVYAGPDADHRAHVGALVMLPEEAAAFLALVNDDPMDLVADTIRNACTAGIRDGKACGICERIIAVTREAQ